MCALLEDIDTANNLPLNNYFLLLEKQISYISKSPNKLFYLIKTLQSKGGMTFESFAKDNQYEKDLYSDLVVSRLETDLLTSTWQKIGRGKGNIGANCSLPGDFTVEDVKEIKVNIHLFIRINFYSLIIIWLFSLIVLFSLSLGVRIV